jgi:hypothetical protein
MSKKLIAVAAAAALALTGLVAAPASATSAPIVTISDASVTGSVTASVAQVEATAAVNQANTANVLTHGTTTATGTRTTVKFTVAISDATARTVAVATAGGVKMLSTLSGTNKDSEGVTTLTATDNNVTTDIVFYAWTKSTTAGTVAITANGNTTVYYVKGTAGDAYNIVDAKFPTSVTTSAVSGATERVSFKLTDAFGNTLTSVTDGTAAGQVRLSVLGATTVNDITYNVTRKQFETYVYSGTTSTVAMSLALNATDLSDNGWAAPVKSAFATSSSASLSAQVTTLTAQVAALTASVTALTADYNSVAKKYNKLVKKSKRVALK